MNADKTSRAASVVFDLETRNGNLSKVFVSFGQDNTIKIPSAMWPLKGKRSYFLNAENTELCTDERIRAVFDAVAFETGKCYRNAENLRAALSEAGYPAEFCCGWLFIGKTVPVHHAVVIIRGDSRHGTMVFDLSNIDYTEAETAMQTMPTEECRKWFVDWIASLQDKPKSSYATFGQALPNAAYVVAECSYEDAIKIRAKLEKAYPKHPALGGFCADTKTPIQQALQQKGVK